MRIFFRTYWIHNSREKINFCLKTKQKQSKTKLDKTLTSSFFQTGEVSLKHLKGRKTVEKPNYPLYIIYLELYYLQ